MIPILHHGLAYAALLGVVAVEYFFRAPFAPTMLGLSAVAARSMRALRSKHISDHWKEIVLLRYARDMAVHTFRLAALLAGCALLMVVPALVIDRLVAPAPSVMGAMGSVAGALAMTVSALIYSALRSRLAK